MAMTELLYGGITLQSVLSCC